ncbi:unnamed protein product [Heligmosomoides polygyrus]|uniref:Uncharacterized protein n=1 Tax=Heligmosomoides polygyrus TaxID=6339 RepID=A0A183FWF2_HELPZ|nr:unnamed protein product [Heligmosomoides polygyrus]
MANTYWQRPELKIIKTRASSSCKYDTRSNLVDFRQKKEFVCMYRGKAFLTSGRDFRAPVFGSETPSSSEGSSSSQGQENNAVRDDIFPTDLSSLIDDVISAQNAEEIVRRSRQLKSAITIRLLQDQVRSVVSALSALMKKIYQKSSDETFEPSTEFGALDVPPGEFTIPPSSYGSGGDLSALYTWLQCKSRVPSSTSEYVNFFNKFIHHVVSEKYSRDVWPRLTARTWKRKNQYVDFESELVVNFVKTMYEKANKEVRTSFYFDIFNMITVAL